MLGQLPTNNPPVHLAALKTHHNKTNVKGVVQFAMNIFFSDLLFASHTKIPL
jgi:hypothetical protein